MPTTTFSITASGDDEYLVNPASGTYPPSGTPTRNTSATLLEASRRNVSGGVFEVANALLKFDTSALPDGASIDSATLLLYVSSKTSTDGLSLTVGWYAKQGTNADWTTTPRANAHAGTALASITASADKDFALSNLTGNVSTTGNTELSVHLSQRASDAAPTGDNIVRFASFDNLANPRPRLVVTYDTGGGGDLVGMVGI